MLNLSSRLLSATVNSSRNMSKFCANLAFLFPEKPLQERYQFAKEAGFKAVETGFPFGIEKEDIVAAKNAAGIQQVLINTYTGDVSKGEMGFAAIPGKEKEFKESLEKTIDYAKALGAKKIHIMSGKVEGCVTAAHDTAFENNLRFATEVLEKEDIVGLIEPINKYSVPNYYMNSYDKGSIIPREGGETQPRTARTPAVKQDALDAVDGDHTISVSVSVIQKINSPNLKLMLDIFHLQLIRGNIVHAISDFKNYIGHVQIAQAPYRNEPTTDGEINYKFVLETLKKEGYDDWIGLEYKPLGDTKEGLKWLDELGYSL